MMSLIRICFIAHAIIKLVNAEMCESVNIKPTLPKFLWFMMELNIVLNKGDEGLLQHLSPLTEIEA